MNHVSTTCLLLAAALAGCSAVSGGASENASAGWVSRVLEPGETARMPAGCADAAALASQRGGRLALVREPHGRRTVSVIAHVPPGMQVQPGDEVEISPARCVNGAMPEVRHVLKP